MKPLLLFALTVAGWLTVSFGAGRDSWPIVTSGLGAVLLAIVLLGVSQVLA